MQSSVAVSCCLLAMWRVGPLLLLPIASAETSAWVESSLRRVMPATKPPSLLAGGDESDPIVAALSLAANEHESFQIALRPSVNTSYAVSIGPVSCSSSSAAGRCCSSNVPSPAPSTVPPPCHGSSALRVPTVQHRHRLQLADSRVGAGGPGARGADRLQSAGRRWLVMEHATGFYNSQPNIDKLVGGPTPCSQPRRPSASPV